MTRMFYGIDPKDKKRDDLFKDLSFVSDEYNGANRDNRGTVRPRHTRCFPEPTIKTPAAGPMPVMPTQPATVGDCADTRECEGKRKEPGEDKGMVQEAFPQASSRRESSAQGTSQSAYPSGLSRR